MSGMSRPGDDSELYGAATSALYTADLYAIEHRVLKFFLDHADSRSEAARYILDQVSRDSNTAEHALRSMKRDLETLGRKFTCDTEVASDVEAALVERDRGRCCITGSDEDPKPTYVVPPSVINDEDLQPGVRTWFPLPPNPVGSLLTRVVKGRLRPLLEATISTELTKQLFSHFGSCSKPDQLANLWMMCPRVQAAFRLGHFTIRRPRFEGAPWMIDTRFSELYTADGLRDDRFYAQPSTPDDRRLPLPNDFLLRVHAAVTSVLHFVPIEKDVRAGLGSFRRDVRSLGKIGTILLRGLSRLLPDILRLKIYRYLLKTIDSWGPQPYPGFRRLPFGLGLKFGNVVSKNEANALRLVEKHTTITAPRLLDLVFDKKGEGFLLMTLVPGIPAEKIFWRMTYEEREQLAKDVGKCVAQYRRIPNTAASHLICDTVGGPLTDHRTEDYGLCGPFDSKDGFVDYLTEGLESRQKELPLSQLYKKDYEILFTHADLHLSNLLVQKGRLSGIVDWENAGFRPEFWEYTRAVWAYMGNRRLEYEFSLAFEKSYKEELEAEKMLWQLRPAF